MVDTNALPPHMRNPRDVNVPHDEWYENQIRALSTVLGNNDRFMFFEMPTGSGKSAIPTALSSSNKVLVTVGTLNRLSQYENEYGFDVIRGRSSYPCILKKKLEEWKSKGKEPTAADCHYTPMRDCPSAMTCPYIVAKDRGLASDRLAVTYKYAFLSRLIRERTGIVVCDEAHESAEQIIGFATFEVSEFETNFWWLPDFPLKNHGPKAKGDLLTPQTTLVFMRWLQTCISKLVETIAGADPEDEMATKAERERQKFEGMLDNLQNPDSLWFLECRDDLTYYRGKTSAGLRVRPLDPSIIAGRLWSSKQQVILMSATIGDPSPLAQALGINHYYHQFYPHPIPANVRPIVDLGFPRMTWGNISKDNRIYARQAALISSYVKRNFDPDWRGIMLTSSYVKIRELASNISGMLPGRRLIVQEAGVPLAQITDSFINDVQKGDVLIASMQGFGQGLNLRADLARYAVIAGVPFDNHTDRYEQLRKQQNGKYGWWKSYNSIPQGTGRVSRGAKNGDGEFYINYGILADGSATTKLAFNYYSDWFKDAIVGS